MEESDPSWKGALTSVVESGESIVSTTSADTDREPVDESNHFPGASGSEDTAITRRSYMVAVGGAASLAAVPAASAVSNNGYGDGSYGAETYGGVSS